VERLRRRATGERLAELQRLGDYERLISELRDWVRRDRGALRDPVVKEWCGRRFRNLFLTEVLEDPTAVSASGRKIALPATDIALPAGRDRRPPGQRVAERFLKERAEEWSEELPPADTPRIEATLVFCPGLINSMLPMRAFAAALPALRDKHGWRVICADAHPMRSCEANQADLLAAIEDGIGLDWDCRPIPPERAEPPGDVFLLCYSKGAADALTLLVNRPDLARRVRAVFMWAGAVGGSHLADDIYGLVKDREIRAGALGDPLKTIARTFFPVIGFEAAVERIDEYDVKGAIRDLTTRVRGEFLARNSDRIEALEIPFFNLTGATSPTEVPYFQIQGALSLSRRDSDNDMQLTQEQARLRIPMATDLAVFRAHHWDLSYDPFPFHTRMGSANLNHPFPREAALTAIFRFAAELGLIE
jgi:hypothetical protein